MRQSACSICRSLLPLGTSLQAESRTLSCDLTQRRAEDSLQGAGCLRLPAQVLEPDVQDTAGPPGIQVIALKTRQLRPYAKYSTYGVYRVPHE